MTLDSGAVILDFKDACPIAEKSGTRAEGLQLPLLVAWKGPAPMKELRLAGRVG